MQIFSHANEKKKKKGGGKISHFIGCFQMPLQQAWE